MVVYGQWMGMVWMVSLVIASTVALQPVNGADVEAYVYQETTGNTTEKMQWRLTKANGYTLTCASPKARHVTITDANYDTRRWQMTTTDGKTQVVGERNGQTITIRGTFDGNPVDKDLKIDDRPWYQATSLSLRGLIASKDTQRTFWTIRLKTLTIHKIKALKKEVEPVAINDPDQLQRIRLTLTGWLAPFWKSDYWFALPGGVFYRFQGPSGPPGSPITTITRTAG